MSKAKRDPLKRRVVLKDGREAVLRRFRLKDARGLMELNLAVAAAGEGVVRGPEEIDETPKDVARKARKLTRREEWGEAGCVIVAGVGGRLVAEASARRFTMKRLRHVAVIGLGVHPEYQGIGVGRAAMEVVMEWCRSRAAEEGGPGVLRVELQVISDNARAVALYKSMGFEFEGRRKGFVREADGTMRDDDVMGVMLRGPGS